MKSKILITALIILLSSCSNYDVEKENQKTVEYKYGYNKDQYIFQEKKIKAGDTFGDILEDVGVDYPEIFEAPLLILEIIFSRKRGKVKRVQ